MARWLACALVLAACNEKKEAKPLPPPPPRPTTAFDHIATGMHVAATIPQGFELNADQRDGIEVGSSFEPGAWDLVHFMWDTDAGGATPEAIVNGLDLRDREILQAPGEVAPGRFARVTTRSPLGKPKTKCQTVEVRWAVGADVLRCDGVNCDGRWRDLLEVCKTATVEPVK